MDVERQLGNAVVAILTAHAGVQAITGRTSRNIVPDDDIGAAALPCFSYLLVTSEEVGGTGDNRAFTLQLSAFAEGPNAKATTQDLVELAETALSVTAFAAQGVDAMILRRRRYGGPVDQNGTQRRARSSMDASGLITK